MRITLIGLGKMGSLIKKIALEQGHILLPSDEIANSDVVIDFALAEGILDRIAHVSSFQKPHLIGTTGWDKELLKGREISEKNGGSLLFAPNFSLGMALFLQLLKQARLLFQDYDVAGVEWHHREKKDAPSGTSLAIGEALGMQEPFASVRLGSLPGTHQVTFSSPFDSIHLTHEAHNREGLAVGALKAAEWLYNQKKTGWYTLEDLVRSLYSTHHPL